VKKRTVVCAGLAALVSAGVTIAASSVVPSRLASGLPESLGFSTDRLRKLDAAMQAEIDAGKYAAISVMIARHGEVIKDSRYGYQDLAKRSPLQADAIFRIASMTKPVTGVALMILYEEGKWQLDDPVSKFIPEFAALKVATAQGPVALDHPITMRELVTSTAGFAAGYAMGSASPDVDRAYAQANLKNGTLADMVEKLSHIPLESQPGAKFRYGYQHDIQAAVVERISGQSFGRFLRERLFLPLGMVDTGFGVAPEKRGRLVPLYAYDHEMKLVLAREQGAFTPVAGETPTFLSGAGGLYSTMSDYMRFAQMLANGGALKAVRILAPSTVKLMMSDLLPEGVQLSFMQPILGVGYGVDLGVVLDPGRASFNSGGLGKGTVFWTGAHGTWFWIDPVNDVIALGMTQQETAGAAHMGMPTPAPDLRAISRSLIYQALIDPVR
jgi:CubicO group peptidase (beta-lactamase class C family)